ncbi:MAG: hypothetical protein AAGF83_11200 [Cyanobacteria bacterium P01_G01_bin.67]
MLPNIFFISLMGFLALYILRGIGLITFLPGGVISALLMTAIVSGLTWGIFKTRRY